MTNAGCWVGLADAATWGVWVNGILAGLTLILVAHTIWHNNRMWERQTRKSRTRLLLPSLENRGCIYAPLANSKDPAAPLTPAYFFRLPVSCSVADAKDVEVLAPELWQHMNGAWIPRRGWIPAYFLWNTQPRRSAQRRIPQAACRWCVFGYVSRPTGDSPSGGNLQLVLTMTAASFSNSHILSPGRYKVRLEITASNGPSTIWDLVFRLEQSWSEELDGAARRMLVFEEPVIVATTGA